MVAADRLGVWNYLSNNWSELRLEAAPREDLAGKMRRKIETVPAVHIANPKTVEFKCLHLPAPRPPQDPAGQPQDASAAQAVRDL